MPFKDPATYREYMRRYRQQQRKRKPDGKPEGPTPEPTAKADPEHVRRLKQAVGMAVATPRGRGVLIRVSGEELCVHVGGGTYHFHPDQVGLW